MSYLILNSFLTHNLSSAISNVLQIPLENTTANIFGDSPQMDIPRLSARQDSCFLFRFPTVLAMSHFPANFADKIWPFLDNDNLWQLTVSFVKAFNMKKKFSRAIARKF